MVGYLPAFNLLQVSLPCTCIVQPYRTQLTSKPLPLLPSSHIRPQVTLAIAGCAPPPTFITACVLYAPSQPCPPTHPAPSTHLLDRYPISKCVHT
jgi:hypothetical protein